MRRAVGLSIAVVVAASVVFFVPVMYTPAVPPICSLTCADSGSSAAYRSVSAQLLGQGAIYWVVTPSLARYCISLWVVSSGCDYGYFG